MRPNAELEDELTAMVETVIKHRENYARLTDKSDAIQGAPVRHAAKQELADIMRSMAIEEDRAWRDCIIRTAGRIADEHARPMAKCRILLTELHERVKNSAINYGDFEDLLPEIEEFLGIADEPEDPRETKGDLDFHREREEHGK